MKDDVKKSSENSKVATNFSAGYGGKYGVQQDRVDKSAVGFEYQAKSEKHSSQIDYAKGFGGKYGVAQDRVDKSAVGFEYEGKTEKHSSQVDYAKGFGGKYGVAQDRVDKSAVGFEYEGKTEKHASQVDYAKGFGGKYGVAQDRVDKSAVGFDHVEKLSKHSSQVDYSKGFGGKYGVQENKDKSASTFTEPAEPVGTKYEKAKLDAKADVKSLKNRFESSNVDDAKKRAEDIRKERLEKDKLDKELEKVCFFYAQIWVDFDFFYGKLNKIDQKGYWVSKKYHFTLKISIPFLCLISIVDHKSSLFVFRK